MPLNRSIKFWRDSEKADITAIGPTVIDAQSTDVLSIDVPGNYGPSTVKVELSRAKIPKPDATDELIAYIKKFRAQFRVREQINELAYMIVEGFRLKGSPELKDLEMRLQLGTKLQRIVFELLTLGWCVVYVSEPKDGYPTLTILHNVTIKRSVDGSYMVFLKLDDKAKLAIQANSKYYPGYWTKDINNENGINISRLIDPSGKWKQGGAYFISLETDAEDILPVPPIYPILGYELDSEMILTGLGTAIDLIKFYLLQARIGNKEGQDIRDGRPKPLSKERLMSMVQNISASWKAGALVGASDIEIVHNIPKDDIYDQHLRAVSTYLGLSDQALGKPPLELAKSGDIAIQMLKELLPKIDGMRHHILENMLLKPMLSDMNGRIKGVQLEGARFVWTNLAIHDVRTQIDRAKLQMATGGCSIQYINEMFDPDYDLDEQVLQKKIEQKNAEFIGLIFEPAQGLADKAIAAAPDPAAATSTEVPPTSGKKTTGKPTPDNPQPNPIAADTGGRPTN